MNHPEHTAYPEEIAACTDPHVLLDWHDHADDMSVNIAATIQARNAADVEDDNAWFIRASDKYAHCRVAVNQCVRRLHRIGYTGPIAPGVHRAAPAAD